MNEQIIEENQSISNIKVNTLVVINKFQKTGEDGKKLGYSWNTKDILGLVTSVSEKSFTMKLPDTTPYTYDVSDDKDYYYRFSKGTEIEYEEQVKLAILDKQGDIERIQKDLDNILKWEDTFKHSFSFIGKLVAFAKEFNK